MAPSTQRAEISTALVRAATSKSASESLIAIDRAISMETDFPGTLAASAQLRRDLAICAFTVKDAVETSDHPFTLASAFVSLAGIAGKMVQDAAKGAGWLLELGLPVLIWIATFAFASAVARLYYERRDWGRAAGRLKFLVSVLDRQGADARVVAQFLEGIADGAPPGRRVTS